MTQSEKVTYDTVASAVEKRINWQMNTSFEKGIPLASAESGKPCPECNKLSAYQIFSYSTLIYSECTKCGRIVANGYRYSRTTSKLQTTLQFDLPEMKKALQKAYAYEKEQARIARNERARDRRKVANGNGTLTHGRNSIRLQFPDSEDLTACTVRTWNESVVYESYQV